MSTLNLSDAQLVVAVLRMESDLSRAMQDIQVLRDELQRRLGASAPAAPAAEPAASAEEGKKERKKRVPLSEEAKAAMKAKAAATRAANKAKSATSSVVGEESELEEGEVREEKPAAEAPATPEKPKKTKKEKKAPGAPKKEKKPAEEAAPAEEKPKKEKKQASLGVLAWTAFKEGVRAEMKAAAAEGVKIKSDEVMKVAKERKDADKAAYEKFVADFKAAHAPAAEAPVDDEADGQDD